MSSVFVYVITYLHASQLGKSLSEEDADDDDQISSPPAKKSKTSHPDTSQCVCLRLASHMLTHY